MKLKTVYICESCEFQSTKWLGKCPECQAWNSFSEDVINSSKKSSTLSSTPRALQTSSLSNSGQKNPRLQTGISEFDRVVGSGLMEGGVTLLSGEPGIGKSTLTLQITSQISEKKKTLLHSAEESLDQVSQRAARIGIKQDKIEAINEYNLETILETIRSGKFEFAVIDSIQVISSAELSSPSGSISQVRYCTEKIVEFAKNNKITILIIGHVTKDGNIAGPRMLEHLVDTVLQFEGDRSRQFRLLRPLKNRFGSIDEVGIFEMHQKGLKEVKNPSFQFLEERPVEAIGSAITSTIEGQRPFLLEVQALVSKSPFGYPKRTATGFDLNRLQLLIAVLEKYAKLNLQDQDVFINVVGGMRIKEPSADLAVLMAIASSFLKKSISNQSIIFGEVGLSGELRQVSHFEKRIKEAEKMGFKEIISPQRFKSVLETIQFLRNDA